VLVFTGLGPEKWQPRSGLGWQIDHFVGYFILTLIFCFAWARPLVVAGALVVFAVLLEASQALTTERSSNAEAAFYSACGVR
jgi:VanZ family protein